MTAQTDYFCVQFSELGNSIAYKIYNNVGRENRKYIFLFLHKNVTVLWNDILATII